MEIGGTVGDIESQPFLEAIRQVAAELLYEVPLMLEREGLADVVVRRLGLICHMPELTDF